MLAMPAPDKLPKLNARGQEEAPFELLVAVIIMGFVLFIGMQAMAQLQLSECTGRTEKTLENLKTAIETVATERGKQNLNFRLPGCFKEEKQDIMVKQIRDKQGCMYFCKQLAEICTVLYYDAEEIPPIVKCLSISYLTTFPTEALCGEKEDYALQDLYNDIPQGNYILISRPNTATQAPTVCAYLHRGA